MPKPPSKPSGTPKPPPSSGQNPSKSVAHHCDFPAACHFSARVCAERNPAPTVWDNPTSTDLRT